MKKLYFLLVFFSGLFPLHSAQYFIATNGNDMASGTITAPFLNFSKAYELALPGDTIWIRGGKHAVSEIWAINKSGSVSKYFNLWGYEQDILYGDSIILEVNASNGIRIQQGGAFWHIKGLVVQNSADNGIRIEGSYNIIENCVFRRNSDSGLTIQQSNGTMPNDGSIAAFNLILNCDSYYNDENTDNADGFACKLSPGAGNVFRGCRSWANGDDGWDFYYSRFQIIVEDCWTFRNGLKGGNGNGFKSNGSASSSSTPRTQAPHVYIRCIAFDHKYKTGSNNKGFDQNHNEGNVTMINCLSFDNEKNYAYQEDTQNGKKHLLRNCVGFEPYSEKLARTLLPGEIINQGTKEEISYESSNTWFGNTIEDQFNSWNLAKSLNSGWVPSRTDYQSLSLQDAMAPRKKDGSLPENGFGRLNSTSLMKNAGSSSSWDLSLPANTYPANPEKPLYVTSTIVTTVDGMPDLGPFEIASVVNPENKKPQVSILTPANGTDFNTNDKITFQIEAADEDGTISRVELLMGTNLIAVKYSAPFHFEWTGSVAGSYTFFARAYDNEGASTISNALNIKVKASGGGEIQLGKKQNLLQLTGSSLIDGIQNKTWSTANAVSLGNNRIKLTYSSSKGGIIISPSIDLSVWKPDSLTLNFTSSGGGNRNLNIYFSSDNGMTWSNAIVQTGAANGVIVPVRLNISDKFNESGILLIKLEAANTIEVWDIQVNGYEKIKSHLNIVPMLFNNIKCLPSITSGFLVISMDLMRSVAVHIDLFDLNGSMISSIENGLYHAGSNKIVADISQAPAGVYFIRFSVGSEIFTTKIIKK